MASSQEEIIAGLEKQLSYTKAIRAQILSIVKMAIPILAVVAAIKAIKQAIPSAAIGDQIKDDAQKVYLSATAYQEWGYVLEQNGVQISSLKMGMRQFSKAVISGDEKLKKYGITTTDVSTAFEQAVYHIQEFTTQTEKIAALTELFGTRASELMPILNMTNTETKQLLKTYRMIGATMSDELVKKSDALTDSITELKSAWQGLKNTIGGLFMGPIKSIVNQLTITIAKINILIKEVLDIEETWGNLGASDMQDSLEGSVDAAKELKRTLAGFDELNVLNGDTEDTTDASEYAEYKGTFGIGIDSEMLKELDAFKQKVEENLLLVKTLAAILAGLTIAGLLTSIKIIPKDITSIVSSALVLAGTIEFISGLVNSIKEGLNFENLSQMIGGVVLAVAGLGLTFGTTGMAVGLLIGSIGLLVAGLYDFIKTGEMSDAAFTAIILGIAGIGTAIALLTGGWIPLLVAAVAGVVVTVIKYKDEILAGLNSAWEFIKTAFSTSWEWIVAKWDSFTEWIKTSVEKIGTFFSESWSKFAEGIKDIFENIKVWFQDNILILFTADYWKTKWENLTNWASEGIKNVVNTIIEKIEGMINNIANKINNSGLVQGINKLTGASIQIPTVSIPRMAGGGVFTAPSIVEVGEYSNATSNPEIITPQSVMMQTMQSANQGLINAIYSIGNQISKSVDEKDTNLYMDTVKVTRRITREQSAQNKRQGSSLVLV